jgi:hypothetical protein
MVSRLFPQFAQRVNILSGGSRGRVEDLYELLAEASATTGLGDRFFAVVDRDSGPVESPGDARLLSWNRYHIENYLLEPTYVLAALQALQTPPVFSTEEEITAALTSSAQTLVNRLVLQELVTGANRQLVSSIRVGAPRDSSDPATDLVPSIEGSAGRVAEVVTQLLEDDYLAQQADSYARDFEKALKSGDWIERFPGRLVLREFVSTNVPGVSYENFRNLVIDQMVDDGFQPEGMKDVIDAIEA